MNTKNEVWVYIEQEQSLIHDVSFELLGKARELAEKLNVNIGAFILGQDITHLSQRAIYYGAKHVYMVDDEALSRYRTLPYAKAACHLIRKYDPQIVLFGATPLGRDLAPRIASSLKTGLTADCTDLQIGDYTYHRKTFYNILYQIRPAFGGNIIATIVSPECRPQMASVREGVMKPPEPAEENEGEVFHESVSFEPADLAVEILQREVALKKINLKGANIIVSGGYGVGNKDNFKLIEQLAETLGGVVGASRAAVDAGFIGKEHQVGQTGTTVRPKLYIAAGISGAVQHTAGMNESSKIIAINKDPGAPIFKIAHYGIVGDLNEVIPKLIEEYKHKD